jgi:chorismate synthase
MTQQQATKERLKSYKEVVALLRQSSQEDCDAIVRILKSKDSLEDACNVILEGGPGGLGER